MELTTLRRPAAVTALAKGSTSSAASGLGGATVSFEVARPDRGRAEYRLVLIRTSVHLDAVGAVAVRAAR